MLVSQTPKGLLIPGGIRGAERALNPSVRFHSKMSIAILSVISGDKQLFHALGRI